MKTKTQGRRAKTQKSDRQPAGLPAAPCVAFEGVVAALLTPTLEVMEQAGMARLSIEKDGSVLMQLQNGHVMTVTPPKPNRTNYVLGTLISWLGQELGEANARKLIEQLPRSDEASKPTNQD